jgi:oligopeptide transport system substrate-binding protein
VTGVCPWFLSDVCTAAATVPLRRDVVQSLKADAQEKNDAAAAQGQTSALTWCSDPTALVTNGAYTVKTYSDSEGLTLARRGGGSGPDTLHFLFAATAEDAWALYEAGTVDFVAPLPQAQLQELAKNPDWSATPELAVQALLFNSSADPFSDPLVRQAFSLATDRTALAAAIPASSAADALVPSGVPGVEGGDDFRTVGGSLLSAGGEAYAADQDKAKSLLAQAGFESGLSFPSLTCYYSAEDSGAAAAAAVLPQMWETALHVQVKMEALPEKELQKTLQSGEYTLALRRLTGFADDAESFLSFWKSTSENNVIRYFNSAYDTLLTVIDSASDVTGRQGCLHDAESLLLTDCPLTPLCWTGTAWKLRETDTGLCRDARGWFNFANIQTAQG